MNFQEENEHITKNLPQMPDILSGVFDAIKVNSIEKVARTISSSTEFEKYFLNIINSGYFSAGTGDIKSTKKAVAMFGLMRIKNVVLTLSLKDMLCLNGKTNLFEHSLKCALITRNLSINNNNIIDPDDAYMIGFLHDIGKAVLYKDNCEKYEDVESITQKNGQDIVEYENSIFSTNHSTVGAMILKKWKMPNIITDCIRYHHAPFLSSIPSVCGLIYASDKILTEEDLTSEQIIFNRLSIELKDSRSLKLIAKTKTEEFMKALKTK